MKLFTLLFITVLGFIGCNNDNGITPKHFGTLKGKITDSQTGNPIKDANIQTDPATISVISDSLGEFIISNIDAGPYVISVLKVCYKVGIGEASVIENETISLDIPLTKLAFSDSWDMSAEYSIINNPNGAWSYGRKWNPGGSAFDILNIRWGDSGWYLGNWGHGGPSIQEGPNLWAKDNSNGIPVVRWTCPISGYYNLSSSFKGVDSRGVDVATYVTLNDSIIFNDNIEAYLEITEYSFDCIFLNQNDYLDFSIKWNGNIYYETSWTIVNGTFNKYVEE